MFVKEIGVPDAIICDPSREKIQGETTCQQVGTNTRGASEVHTLWANRAELVL